MHSPMHSLTHLCSGGRCRPRVHRVHRVHRERLLHHTTNHDERREPDDARVAAFLSVYEEFTSIISREFTSMISRESTSKYNYSHRVVPVNIPLQQWWQEGQSGTALRQTWKWVSLLVCLFCLFVCFALVGWLLGCLIDWVFVSLVGLID